MSNVTIQKRGKFYQYKFEIARVDEKREFLSKSGFKTKSEAEKEGILAYNEYLNTGRSFSVSEMSYSDFLDYWLDNHCKINLKYHTIEAYSNIVKTHLKPNLGFYKLSQITKTTLQDFLNKIYVEKAYSKNFLNNIRKVLKCSFNYAVDNEYVKVNSAANLKLPKYDESPKDVAHIFTTKEINTILRFKKDKGGAIAGCERHNERKKEAYKSNPDIDITRTKYNYHIIQAPKYTYGRKIKELIKKYECKTRKDSIRLV